MKNYIEKLKFAEGFGYTLSVWDSVSEFNIHRKKGKNWKLLANVHSYTAESLKKKLFDSRLLKSPFFSLHSSYKHFNEFGNRSSGSLLESVAIDIKRDIPRINKYLNIQFDKLGRFTPNDQLVSELEQINLFENKTHYFVKDEKYHFAFLFNESFQLEYIEYSIPINVAVVKNKYTLPSLTSDIFYKRCDYVRALISNFPEVISEKDPRKAPVVVLHGYLKVDPPKTFSEDSVQDFHSLLTKRDDYLMIRRPRGQNYGLIEKEDLYSFFELFRNKYWKSSIIEEWIQKKGSGTVRRLAVEGKLKNARMREGTKRWEIEVCEYLTYLLESNDDRNMQSLEKFLETHSGLKITDLKTI